MFCRHFLRRTRINYLAAIQSYRVMSTSRPLSVPYLSHEERTAKDFRDSSLHQVSIHNIASVNDQIRTFKLFITQRQNGMKFLPGQWLDVHIPGLKKAGGFTITSSPQEALPEGEESARVSGRIPFIELAVKNSPENPAAAWLWQSPETILNTPLTVRVGGSFVWPPPDLTLPRLKRLVLVAGGVGINPLISILSHIAVCGPQLDEVRMLYSTKIPTNGSKPADMLFVPRLLDIFSGSTYVKGHLQLFLTGTWDHSTIQSNHIASFLDNCGKIESVSAFSRRPSNTDLLDAAGRSRDERAGTVYYVCGPPDMTDSLVQFFLDQEGVSPEQVLCEKWW